MRLLPGAPFPRVEVQGALVATLRALLTHADRADGPAGASGDDR